MLYNLDFYEKIRAKSGTFKIKKKQFVIADNNLLDFLNLATNKRTRNTHKRQTSVISCDKQDTIEWSSSLPLIFYKQFLYSCLTYKSPTPHTAFAFLSLFVAKRGRN